jgi:hypothetical protein
MLLKWAYKFHYDFLIPAIMKVSLNITASPRVGDL